MDRLASVIKDYKMKNVALESTDFAIARWLVNNKQYKIVVYGAGNYGSLVEKYLSETLNLDVDFYVDKNSAKTIVNGKKVIQRDSLIRDDNNDKYVVFIGTRAVEQFKDKMDIYRYCDRIHAELIINIIPLLKEVV